LPDSSPKEEEWKIQAKRDGNGLLWRSRKRSTQNEEIQSLAPWSEPRSRLPHRPGRETGRNPEEENADKGLKSGSWTCRKKRLRKKRREGVRKKKELGLLNRSETPKPGGTKKE